ncbi:MAG: hypothetical protein J5825_09730, partial [Lachnospiraceae bacterium]|nr:hypothetical protein [Lachnospiraceae bacterium]
KDWGADAPESALSLGADLVIQSTHKTLPAFTQTALLHAGPRVNEELSERIRHYLNIYQTSSPSYLFMSSLDCLADLLESEEGRELGRAYVRNLEKFYLENAFLKHYHVLENSSKKDPSKLVIFSEEPFGGSKLADLLRDRYHLEVEMEAPGYVIAMTSFADSAEGFDRLTAALRELDAEAGIAISDAEAGIAISDAEAEIAISDNDELMEGSALTKNDTPGEKDALIENVTNTDETEEDERRLPVSEQNFSLWDLTGRIGERLEGAGEAFSRKESDLTLMSIAECVKESREAVLEAADYVWLYPPGIPFLVPGERVLPETAEVISKLKESGYHICGMRRADGKIYVRKAEETQSPDQSSENDR